jgi:hypothetical protein
MDLRDEAPSRNFIDQSAGQPLHKQINYLLWAMLHPKEVQKNNEYIERNRDKTYSRQLQKMTVNDFTPEEWRLVKENNFGLDDIMVMRKLNRSGKVSPAQANLAAN